MSYILDALQKSEHARHRGKVPDLNTLPETTPSVARPGARSRPPYLAAGFALALAAAILGWWRPWEARSPHSATPAIAGNTDAPHQGAAAAQAAPLPAPTVPQASPPQARADVPTQTEPPAPPAPPAPSQPSPPPAALEPLAPPRPPLAAPAAARAAAPVAKPRREPTPAEPTPAPQAAASPATPAPVASRKAPDGRILSIHELPPAVRSSLPRLDISGFAAAPDSGKRMVVINDRLVQEGEEVVPGVTLTSAAKDGVVLDFQGYRFRAQQ